MATPLAYNPQLPAPPAGYQDAQYAADEGSLRNSFISQYHDLLQQLGYTDDLGNYIPGSVEIAANRTRDEFNRSLGLAAEGVTNQSQREGTLFSGLRGVNTGRAEHPYRTGLAQLEEDLPKQLGSLYEHAGGLFNDYVTGRNSLLAQAAGRYVPPDAPPAGTDTGAGDTGGGDTPPPIDPNAGTGITAEPILREAIAIPPHGSIAPTPLKTAVPSTRTKPRLAQGGVFSQPTDAVIGEAGPEAVVPLGLNAGPMDPRLIQVLLARLRAEAEMHGDKTFGQGMDEFGGGPRIASPIMPHGSPPPPRQAIESQPRDEGRQAIPNVAAVGLKAAAKIMSELAKHHEHAAQPAGHPGKGAAHRGAPGRGARPQQHPGRGQVHGPVPYEGGLTRNDLLRFAGR